MHISLWTAYFIDLSPEDMVLEYQTGAWSHLELSTEHSQMLLDRGDPAKAGADFKAYAADHGIHFPQGHLKLDCDVAGDNADALIEELKQWLDLYLALGVQAGVIHAGGGELYRRNTDPALILERRAAAFRALSDHVRGTDLTLCIENTMGDTAYAPALLEIIKAAGDSNLGICLDTGHLNISGGSQKEFIQTARTYLRALHIADNEGATDQHLMPYGRGNVDWDEVLTALADVGYTALFNLEIPGENRCSLEIRRIKMQCFKQIARYMVSRMEDRLVVP